MFHIACTCINVAIEALHRSQTLLWYNQCNGGYDQFVTAGTISSYGILTWRTKMERIDGKKMVISF